MRSIKPGRGPSMMEGISLLFVAVFGVIWTILAFSMGGGLFALFGVVFVIMAIVSAVYNFKNATNKNRYSLYDITEDCEEPDPLNERFGNGTDYDNSSNYNDYYSDATYNNTSYGADSNSTHSRFCPYCGTPAAQDFQFCNSCGKKLP